VPAKQRLHISAVNITIIIIRRFARLLSSVWRTHLRRAEVTSAAVWSLRLLDSAAPDRCILTTLALSSKPDCWSAFTCMSEQGWAAPESMFSAQLDYLAFVDVLAGNRTERMGTVMLIFHSAGSRLATRWNEHNKP
jgi:hypothetical protein